MERWSVRVASLVAIVIVLATDVLYVVLIRSQGGAQPEVYLPFFVGGYLALMAALIALALIPRPGVARVRPALRIAAITGLVVLGFLASFSIGVPILIAGLLVVVALVRSAAPVSGTRFAFVSGVAAGSVALLVLIAGFEVTDHLIVCPKTGTAGGSGRGIVTGPYHYECNEGQLTYHSG